MVQCVMWPGYGRSVDWWSLGVLVHELVTGVTPWRHHDIYTLYDMIIDQEFTWHTGELTARPLSAECCRHLHNSVTNLISLAAVISDSRRDRWWEWGGGWRDTRDTGDQGFRHQAPGPGCRQGGRERWVFDLLSHQKLFRDLGVAQLGPARLRIIPGSSVSIGTRWAVTRIIIIMTLIVRWTLGVWGRPLSLTWDVLVTVTSTRSMERTCGDKIIRITERHLNIMCYRWDVHELPPADRDRFIGFWGGEENVKIVIQTIVKTKYWKHS